MIRKNEKGSISRTCLPAGKLHSVEFLELHKRYLNWGEKGKMYILQIEYPAPNFDTWRKAFNQNTIDPKKSGLQRYQILRPVDNSNYVIVELEFTEANQAESFISVLHELWRADENKLMLNPQGRIFEVVEAREI